MKILTYTTLFPNAATPQHGVFVRHRLKRVIATGHIEARVVAPTRWFPFHHRVFGQYARFAAAPLYETMDGLPVYHPRYPVVPGIGMNWTPALLAAASKKTIKNIIDDGFDFDLIDAHYFYPDGVAAARLKKLFNRPLVITARGTDINLIPQYPKPRRMILEAAETADAIITVCAALKDALLELGVNERKVTVLRNGVDLQLFQPPAERDRLRQQLGMRQPTLLSVGHLIERKGHDRVIRALKELPDYQLVVIGAGEEDAALKNLVKALGLETRVLFTGAVSQDELRRYYGAADVLVLASSREGWANVLLESMACGTPVVATPVWGTPEVVAESAAGVLSADRSPEALANAIRKLFANYPAREATRAYAEKFSWDATTEGQLNIFRRLISSNKT